MYRLCFEDGIRVTGYAMKGVISDATVRIYKSDRTTLIGMGITDSEGKYDISLTDQNYTEPTLVSITGGIYTDENTGETVSMGTVSISGVCPGLSNLAENTVHVTPVTNIAFLSLGSEELTESSVSDANALAASALGIPGVDIIVTKPDDLTMVMAEDDDQGRYGIALAMISKLCQDASGAVDLAVLEQKLADLGEDLSDDGVLTSSNISELQTAVNTLQGLASANSGEVDTIIYTALENNGEASVFIIDSDGDGVNDLLDAFPFDPTETVDSDADGWGDNSDRFPDEPRFAQPTNLLENPGAEEDDAYWTAVNATDEIAEISTESHSGDKSFYMETIETSGNIQWEADQISITIPGKAFHVAAWAKTENTLQARLRLSVILADSSSSWKNIDLPESGDWSYYSETFDGFESDIESISVRQYMDKQNGAKFWADDWELYVMDETDSDGDGISDALDPDDDNDGAKDGEDLYPLDASQWTDQDRPCIPTVTGITEGEYSTIPVTISVTSETGVTYEAIIDDAAYTLGNVFSEEGEHTLLVMATKTDNGLTSSRIIHFTITGKVESPDFSRPEGTYKNQLSFEISSTTDDLDIYYTTDNSTPTNASTLYSGDITLTETTTVKAIALKDHWDNSDVTTVVYTVDPHNGFWYVGTDGVDDVDEGYGTEDNPLATIEYASDQTQPGDTVYVYEGTYRNSTFGDGDIWNYDVAVLISAQGSEDNYITFTPYPGDNVIIEFDATYGVRINGAAYVRFIGFEVKGIADQITYQEALDNWGIYKIDTDGDGNGDDPILYLILDDNLEGEEHDSTRVMPIENCEKPTYYNGRAIVASDSHHIDIENNIVRDVPSAAIRAHASDYVNIIGNEVFRNTYWTTQGVGAIKGCCKDHNYL